MKEVFQKWKLSIRLAHIDKDRGEEHKEEIRNNEKTYGIKYWGRVRTIPRLHKQEKILTDRRWMTGLQHLKTPETGAKGLLRLTS
eukprot:5956107-Pleurochrysis_carterae.AAC.1